MAPKVQVPCDFGREYINVPEHCNLTLNLQNGEDYLVNSVLMSYNSPEIKRLTSELHQTSLAMDDFDEKAVYCFVDALYTGEIELINKNVFTDVFKMGQVFEVFWLLNRLSDYFENMVKCRDNVDSTSNDAAYKKSNLYLIWPEQFFPNALKSSRCLWTSSSTVSLKGAINQSLLGGLSVRLI